MVYLQATLGRIILYLYFGWRAPSTLGSRGAKYLRWAMGVEFTLYLIGLFAHHYIVGDWMSLYMAAGVFLFFSLGYAMMWLAFWDVLDWLDRRFLGWSKRWSRDIRLWQRRLILCIAVVIVPITLWMGYHNVRYPQVTHRRVVVDRLVKPGQEPQRRLRIVHLTDLHIGEGITQGYVDRAVELTMQQGGDMILVGGDYIDHHIRYAETPQMLEAMSRLNARYGVYYALGNHEYRVDTMANIQWVERVGARLLRDEVVYPADSLVALIGRDDYINESRASLTSLTDTVHSDRPVILLEHTPAELDLASKQAIDLALYGHTHGGQVWPMHLLVWARYSIVSGWARYGQTEVFVNSGIGSAGAPYRIGSRSEIGVIDLYW